MTRIQISLLVCNNSIIAIYLDAYLQHSQTVEK